MAPIPKNKRVWREPTGPSRKALPPKKTPPTKFGLCPDCQEFIGEVGRWILTITVAVAIFWSLFLA